MFFNLKFDRTRKNRTQSQKENLTQPEKNPSTDQSNLTQHYTPAADLGFELGVDDDKKNLTYNTIYNSIPNIYNSFQFNT